MVGHSRSHELEIRSRALPISACRGDARSAAATIGSDRTNPKAESSIFVLVVLLHLCLWDYQYDFDYVIRSYGLAKKSFFFGHLFFNTSWPPQEKLFIWSLFFQYNKRLLLRQKMGGACLYMPHDGHWLASFEVIPPPKKLVFPRPKNENSH